jgi:hypothetical protein
MKRCNYFSSLVVVLLMFFGMTLSAQRYMSTTDATKAVQTVINQNTKMSASIKSSAYSGYTSSSSAFTATETHRNMDRTAKVKVLKVEYGHALLTELSAGLPVSDALLKASDLLLPGAKQKGELDIFQEVEAFYRNLLSK